MGKEYSSHLGQGEVEPEQKQGKIYYLSRYGGRLGECKGGYGRIGSFSDVGKSGNVD